MPKERVRIHSTVRQSFSHGRVRVVEVERILLGDTGPGRPVLHLTKKKKKRAAPLARPETVKAASKKAAKRTLQKRSSSRPAKPSFLNSFPAKSGLGEESISMKGPRRRVTRGGGGRSPSSVGLSAGMPGNEDVDPPKRVSQSTPADRWRDINRTLKD